MAGVTLTASAAMARAPLTVTTRPGTERPGMGTVSGGPTAIAIKYEGSGLVRANSTRVTAPVRRWRAIGVLLTARSPAGTTSVMVQGILNSGSSQQGNASRASVSSNWVKRYP